MNFGVSKQKFLFYKNDIRQKKIFMKYTLLPFKLCSKLFFRFVYNHENENKNPVRPIKSRACDCARPIKSQTRDHNIMICVVLAYAFKRVGRKFLHRVPDKIEGRL